MSGIAGIYHLNGMALESGSILVMTEAMAHRGPDGSGQWVEGPIGMGHRMLHATPESLFESQPMIIDDSKLVITADVRIDNRKELIDKLGMDAGDTGSLTDAEIVLKSYEKWGDDCVSHLLGDFAFAIWDGRQRRLFCARDHFGVKPFCYYAGERLFVFASEVKGVLALKEVPRRLNEGRIADYLVDELEGYDKVSTFYHDVFKLPPAHQMVVSDRGTELRSYWSLDPHKQTRLGSNGEYVEAFSAIFNEAVGCRMRCHSSPGLLLSGGIDSATIWGTVVKLSNKGLPLISLSGVSPPGADCIETRSINELVKGSESSLHEVRLDALGQYLDETERALRQIDDLNDVSMMLQRILYIAANALGVKIVLDGVDADNVTSTTVHIGQLLRDKEWYTAIAEAKGMSYFYQCDYSANSLLLLGLRSAYTPFPLRRVIRGLGFRRRVSRALRDSIIDRDFAGRIGIEERLWRLDSYKWAGRNFTLAEKHALALNHPYLTVGIERYGRVAAAHSVESRHPFLDKRLAEFCLSLPWDQKIYRGWTKILMRRMMKGRIPESIRWRRGVEHLGWQFSKAVANQRKALFKDAISANLNMLCNYIDNSLLKQICTNPDFLSTDKGLRALLQAGALGIFTGNLK